MKKYKHNINKYQKLRNKGMTWGEVAEAVGIDNSSSLVRWVSRNYTEKIKYDYEYVPKKNK